MAIVLIDYFLIYNKSDINANIIKLLGAACLKIAIE